MYTVTLLAVHVFFFKFKSCEKVSYTCNVQDFHLVESPAYTAAVVAEAKGIWRRMQDLNDREVRISHDGQFKGMLHCGFFYIV